MALAVNANQAVRVGRGEDLPSEVLWELTQVQGKAGGGFLIVLLGFNCEGLEERGDTDCCNLTVPNCAPVHLLLGRLDKSDVWSSVSCPWALHLRLPEVLRLGISRVLL